MYILAGGAAFAADYIGLLVLYRIFDISLPVATTVGFIAGLLVSFLLNKYWVFSGSARGGKALAAQGSMYLALVAFNLLATNAIIYGLNTFQIGPEFSKPLTTALITVWNFYLYKTAIFR